MIEYKIIFLKEDKTINMLDIISENSYQTPPTYIKLKGNLDSFSKRISLQHRLVYKVYEDTN